MRHLAIQPLAISLILFSLLSCGNPVEYPFAYINYQLCYQSAFNNNWEIVINTPTGVSPFNISNYPDDDGYPQWSPDGRYIAYSRSARNGPLVIVYDTRTQTSVDLTSDDGGASLTPQWTPTGKICFGYPYSGAKYGGTFIMNPDGTERRQILDSAATELGNNIYFYADGYSFLYVVGTTVFKTNIDNTSNEPVLELHPSSNRFFAIRDFDAVRGTLLVNTNTVTPFSSAIIEYHADTKEIDTLVIADSGYTVFLQKYSRDCSKMVFVEHGNDNEYLSVFEAGVKKRLVEIHASTPPTLFSYKPMSFSHDGRYVAFSKQVFQGGSWISWKEYLYAIDLTTGTLHQIGEGFHPSWNPRP